VHRAEGVNPFTECNFVVENVVSLYPVLLKALFIFCVYMQLDEGPDIFKESS
jgi:hypothetical protein